MQHPEHRPGLLPAFAHDDLATKWANLITEQTAWQSLLAPKRVMVIGNDDGFVVAGDAHYNSEGNEDYSRRVHVAMESHPGPLLTATPAPTLERGWSGFDTSTRLCLRTTQGNFGTAVGGIGVVGMGRLDALPASGTHRMFIRFNGNDGFDLRCDSNNLRVTVGNGAITATPAARALVAGDVGEFHVCGLSWDPGTNLVSFFFDRALVGTAALAGYSPATGRRCVIGSNDTPSNVMTTWTFAGAATRDAPLTLADFQAVCDASKLAGYFSRGAIAFDHAWRMPRYRVAPDYLRDTGDVGGADFEFDTGDERNLVYEVYDTASAAWGF
jgi:hypothetical protein